VAEQNPVWNNMAVNPNWKKKKILVQRRRSFSLSFFPFPLARNKENGNIESRILIASAPFTIQHSATEKDCCKRGRILKH